MNFFYNAYFLKTQQPIAKVQEKLPQPEQIPNSDWIVCDFGDSYVDGTFEEDTYLTQELSEEFGEVIFILDFRLKRRKERQEVNVTNCQKSNDQ